MNDSIKKNAENNRERFDDYRGLLRDPSEEKKTLVVDAVLSPTPRACRSCGSTVVDGNGKAIIVKNGKGNDCPF
jgi:transposase